ncbi:MAG: hypothetical protein MK085_07820 [Phycisphaerales bacterium]|nr:hypothetical protein [Phycisphaerales bacterium]
MPTHRAQTASHLLRATLIVAVACLPLGCYKRVVGTKNAPGYTGMVYESNLGEGEQEGNESLFRVETRTYKGTYFVD